jgi:hypothetical protein
VGILSVYRFTGLTVIFAGIVVFHWRKRKEIMGHMPTVAWWVPGWFHLFFFACLWLFGFYMGQAWMTVAACINLLIGIALHYRPAYAQRR